MFFTRINPRNNKIRIILPAKITKIFFMIYITNIDFKKGGVRKGNKL